MIPDGANAVWTNPVSIGWTQPFGPVSANLDHALTDSNFKGDIAKYHEIHDNY